MTWNPSLIDGPVPIPIYGPVAVDGDGAPYRPLSGWRPEYHLNLPPDVVDEAVSTFLVTPEAPARVFAGGRTAFLRFADEAEARSVLAGLWAEPSEDP